MNLLDQIDEYFIRQEIKPRESHYPSDASACIRQLYYKWTGQAISDPITAGAIWKMKFGDATEYIIIEALKGLGKDVVNQLGGKLRLVGLQYPIGYRVDALFQENNVLNGIEIKSSYGLGIKEIQQKGEPKPEHVKQIICYAYAADIPSWYLIYVGRDNGYRCMFHIEYNKEEDQTFINSHPVSYTFKSILNIFFILETYLKAQQLPGADYLVAIKNGQIVDKFQKANKIYKTDWQCSYCSFKTSCWADTVLAYQRSDNSLMFQ